MRISYNPLWKMLIDRGMNKKELRELSGISTASMAKPGGKGRNKQTHSQKVADMAEEAMEMLEATTGS